MRIEENAAAAAAQEGTADQSPRLRALLAIPELERHHVIKAILEGAEHIAVVGTAASGREAVTLTEQLRPNLIIMGVELPMMNGFAATKEIMIRCPTPVLIIGGKLEGLSSMANESAYRAGALSYLPEAPATDDAEEAGAFLEIVEKVAHSKATRYWRIRQAWETDAQIQAITVFVSNASVEAFLQILTLLPEDFAAPIVVLPYIGKGFIEGFAGWLRHHCALRVRVANDLDILAPATVYVAADTHHLEIAEDRIPILQVSSAPPVRDYRPSGVHLLRTLSRVYGPRGLAVVMKGIREDLLSAMCAIWLEGGRVFAQARSGASRWPPEDILLKLADAVMDPADLAASLTRMVTAAPAAGLAAVGLGSP